jgi:hypothetical protein
MPGMGMASPSISLSTPAMILSSVDLPEPLRPSTPILAPGKKLREMSFKICRLGGTVLLTRFMEKRIGPLRCLTCKSGQKFCVQTEIIGPCDNTP